MISPLNFTVPTTGETLKRAKASPEALKRANASRREWELQDHGCPACPPERQVVCELVLSLGGDDEGHGMIMLYQCPICKKVIAK
jgi:hypothetical protein